MAARTKSIRIVHPNDDDSAINEGIDVDIGDEGEPEKKVDHSMQTRWLK